MVYEVRANPKYSNGNSLVFGVVTVSASSPKEAVQKAQSLPAQEKAAAHFSGGFGHMLIAKRIAESMRDYEKLLEKMRTEIADAERKGHIVKHNGNSSDLNIHTASGRRIYGAKI